MKRKDFLKSLGLVGLGSTIIGAKAVAKTNAAPTKLPPNVCTLIPTETAGPFGLDLTTNNAATYFRKDLREDRTGVRLNLKLKIIGANNCLPMGNLQVNIWHCSKDSLYSGYDNPMNVGQAGKTYLRGYQMTDANGIVEFTTIFPSWYNGRITHIHFQVYVNANYAAISQLTFPITTKNRIYTANPTLYPKGADPMTLASDSVFSDGYNYQIATLTPNANVALGYDAYLEVAIRGSGISKLAEVETGGQFKLGQNFPNPYRNLTTIPFILTHAAEVQIDLWDVNGKKLATIPYGTLNAGNHAIPLDIKRLGIARQNYVYQLQVTNSNGTYRQCKMMTAIE
jgi:protocatechuate 3,4-dioxygenase beta subunit